MSAGHPHPEALRPQSLTQKWLRQNIQIYTHRDSVYSHVDAVLDRYPTIRPKTDVYTYDDGRTQLLLCLHGLLPVTYRGASYNIPVAVWITRDYPRQPPMAYVVPTNEMLVRAGRNMDVSGRCQIDYLRNWERKSEGCNLILLLEAMQDQFSREPPVYAKPQPVSSPSVSPPQPGPNHTVTVGAPAYSGKPPPPLPGTNTPPSRQSTTPLSVSHTDERPPLPAKPSVSVVTAVPLRSSEASTSSQLRSRSQSPGIGIVSSPNLALRPPPPLPPQPPTAGPGSYGRTSPVPPVYAPHGRSVSIDSVVLNAPNWSSGSASRSNVPLGQELYKHSQPQGQVGSAGQVSPHNSGVTSPTSILSPVAGPQQSFYPLPVSPAAGARPYPIHQAVPPPFVSPPPLSPPQASHVYTSPPALPPLPPVAQVVSPPAPSIPPPDLLDADDIPSSEPAGVASSSSAPAPPRPPNPELLRLHSQVHAKLESELASLSQAMALDAERLRANQSDLLAGEPAIRDEMARLEAVRDVCRGVSQRLGAVVAEGERNVAELRRKGDPEVDELVCSTAIVYNQLINLVAEDNAIEDTIYHLHRALNTGRIDLERFLRTIRVLAEEQFMKRALIEKIQTGIPVGELSWVAPPGWR